MASAAAKDTASAMLIVAAPTATTTTTTTAAATTTAPLAASAAETPDAVAAAAAQQQQLSTATTTTNSATPASAVGSTAAYTSSLTGSLEAAFWASRSLPSCWGGPDNSTTTTAGSRGGTTAPAAATATGGEAPSSPTSCGLPDRGSASGLFFESPMDLPTGFLRSSLDSQFAEAFRSLSFTTDAAAAATAAASQQQPPLHPISREVFMRVQQQRQQTACQQHHHHHHQQQQQHPDPSEDKLPWCLPGLDGPDASGTGSSAGVGAAAVDHSGSATTGAATSPSADDFLPPPPNHHHSHHPHNNNPEDAVAGLGLTTESCPAGSLAHQLLLLSSAAHSFDLVPTPDGGGTPVSAFLRQLETDGDLDASDLVASILRQSAPGRVTEPLESPATVITAASGAPTPWGPPVPPPPASPGGNSHHCVGQPSPQAGGSLYDETDPEGCLGGASAAAAAAGGAGGVAGVPKDRHVADLCLQELRGRVVSLAKVQYGSRLLQRLLARGSPEHVKLILDETAGELPTLMVDPYGNYLCQQLFEVCCKAQRRQILARLAPCTVCIAQDRRGTHSLQSLIGLVSDEQEELLLLEPMLTSADLLALSTHPHATHVIQRALTSCGPRVKAMIFEPVIQKLGDVARTPHGICVVKRCISAASGESACEQFKAPLLRKLSSAAIGLIQSPYGNYAVQHALDAFGPELCRPILRQVADNFVLLSTQKFSSNVVEKSIAVGCDAEVARLVRTATQPAVVKSLLSSSYGSFVIQKLMTRMDDGDAMKLLRLLMQCQGELGNKRLRSKWERLVACLASRFCIDPAALMDSEIGASSGISILPPPPTTPSVPATATTQAAAAAGGLSPRASGTAAAGGGSASFEQQQWMPPASLAPSTAPSTPPPELAQCGPSGGADWTQKDQQLQPPRKGSLGSSVGSAAGASGAVLPGGAGATGGFGKTPQPLQQQQPTSLARGGGGRSRRWRCRRGKQQPQVPEGLLMLPAQAAPSSSSPALPQSSPPQPQQQQQQQYSHHHLHHNHHHHIEA